MNRKKKNKVTWKNAEDNYEKVNDYKKMQYTHDGRPFLSHTKH